MTGWFAPARIADLALPGLPRTKRAVNERAEADDWALRTGPSGDPLVRKRRGQGGGWEYHWTVLPAAARAALVKRGLVETAEPLPIEAKRADRWTWFERQSDSVRAEAKRRLDVLDAVARIEGIGATRSMAVASAAGQHGVSAPTIWNWLRAIAGIHPNDWLPYLAPERRGGGAEVEIDANAWQMLISDYLRPEQPTWESCCARMREWAEAEGIDMPHNRTLYRKFEREIDKRLIAMRRKGKDAARGSMPAQRRTVADMHAMQLVNIDGHRADVFVRFPDGKIARPTIVAIQDVYSRKMLAWRVGASEDAVLTRLAFADLFKRYGIPAGCLMDNGRAFASKWISGGAKTRFRFKIKEEEPTGILTALGINIHWATPFRGQSKPIERAFRDFCDAIAKHPAFAGAYTGNSPMAKPENYGSSAVPLAGFEAVLAKGIAAHNARLGRRTETARGGSFDRAFEESYAQAPIGRATPEQLRMALLTAEDVGTDRKNGSISLFENRYWTEELAQLAGQRVVVRFDPADLQSEVHVYTRDGRYLVSAPVVENTGFLDVASAKARKRAEADWRRQIKIADQMADLLDASAIAAMLPSEAPDDIAPEPAVIRPVRHRGQTAAALKPRNSVQPSVSPVAQHDVIDRLSRLTLVK